MIEIASFIWIGGALGVIATLSLVILGGFIGVTILRSQGAATLARARDAANGFASQMTLVSDTAIILAAILLILPGFFSDLLGIILLIAPLRNLLIFALKRKSKTKKTDASQHSNQATSRFHQSSQERDSDVIEGDYREISKPDRR